MIKKSMDELQRVDCQSYKEKKKIAVTVVLDNIRSLNNVGSFFRTSDAFLVQEIALCGITATPPHREIQKTALGATESVSWRYFSSTEEAIHNLKTAESIIVSIEQTHNSINIEKLFSEEVNKQHFILIFGNEVEGVSESVLSLSDKVVELPQSGTKHSINVSVCGGIILWEFYRRLHE